jgi:peptidoglycan hydrolase-like protein with peptidoglycan-binding domain
MNAAGTPGQRAGGNWQSNMAKKFATGGVVNAAPPLFPLHAGQSTSDSAVKNHVTNVQKKLGEATYGWGGHTPTYSGVWDATTTSLVKSWQQRAGLAVTGTLSSNAYNLLMDEGGLFDPHPDKLYPLELGSKNAHVLAVQKMFDGLHQTGVYDAATVAKVKAWQVDMGLPATGQLDQTGYNAITNVGSDGWALFQGENPDIGIASRVLAIKTALAKNNKFSGVIDSHYDQTLSDSIHAFYQGASGMTDHGFVNAADFARLTSTAPDVDNAIYDIGQQVADARKWNSDLFTLASWNLAPLALWLKDQGLDADIGNTTGLGLATELLTNPSLASTLNNEVFELGTAQGTIIPESVAAQTSKLTGDFLSDSINMISAIAGFNGLPGLRDLQIRLRSGPAQIAQVWDQWEAAIVPFLNSAKYSTLAADVAKFDQGMFYASGGHVPGAGNTDSVHAMLTPGEFVIKKSAVNALGKDYLDKINKYADGGFVFNLGANDMPHYATGGMVTGSALSGSGSGDVVNTKNVTNNINTTINNPVEESGTESMSKMLTRKAALGVLG